MHRLRYLTIILTILAAVWPAEAGYAAASDSLPDEPTQKKRVSFIGFDVRPSYAFSSFHDDLLKKMIDTQEAKRSIMTLSLHLKYGFTFTPAARKEGIFPGVWQGIGTSLNFLGNPRHLGTPVCIYLFQGAPVWNISRNLSLFYEWNFGLSMGWKPCNGETAYSNLIVGSRMNAYINLGAGLRWNPGKEWSMTAGIDLTHFSNGNTSYPNPGVNMAGIRVGITRSFGKESATRTPETKHFVTDTDTVRKRHPIGYDITLYGAFRKRVYRGGDEPVLLRGRYGIAGLCFSPMWEVSPIFRAGVSADFQWDESSDLKRHYVSGLTTDDIRFYRPPFFSQVSCGLSGRVELVMPYFSVNAGIGYNIVGPPESRGSYQLANLKIHIVKGFYLNIGYQLMDFHRQNNLMLGFGYSFR